MPENTLRCRGRLCSRIERETIERPTDAVEEPRVIPLAP